MTNDELNKEYNKMLDKYTTDEERRMREIRERARKKSVKNEVEKEITDEDLKFDKKKLKNYFIKGAAVIMASVVILGVSGIGPKMIDRLSYQNEVKAVAFDEGNRAHDMLVKSGLHIVPIDQKNDWHNDYSKLTNLSKNDLYAYYHYLGYTETEKIVRALGYDSWNNFLSMEGYFNENGQPDVRVWENYEEARLVTKNREAKENGRQF